MLYYISKKGEQMITLMILFFACGEEKASDSTKPVEEQQETVEDTATEIV